MDYGSSRRLQLPWPVSCAGDAAVAVERELHLHHYQASVDNNNNNKLQQQLQHREDLHEHDCT